MRKFGKTIFIVIVVAVFALILSACESAEIDFTISFDSNGGSEVVSIKTAGNLEIDIPVSTKEGYEFIGWFWDNETFERPFTENSLIENPIQRDAIIYAKWEVNTYTITYNTNGGTDISSRVFSEGDALFAPQKPKKEGYVFAGWYTEAELTNLYTFPRRPAENINLFADWGTKGLQYYTSLGRQGYIVSECLETNVTEIVIPNRYNGELINRIAADAFNGLSSVTSITIPDSITSIGKDAFKDTAWYNNQPDGLIYAGKVVYGYKGIMPEGTSINILEGTKVIAERAFEGFGNLTNITIPDSMTIIGDSAFRWCSSLASITIPSSVTIIPSFAFYGCSSLTSATIPNSIWRIKDSAFSGCSNLTNMIIPNSVEVIEDYAFNECSSLTSITIPSSVRFIFDGAFTGCTSLTSITIADGLTFIAQAIFNGCFSLTSITIPDTVTSIGKDAFKNTAWYDNQPDGLVYAGKVVYGYKGIMPESTSISILEGTKGIAAYAFYGYNNLTSITIPSEVTNIGDSSFYGCNGLTSITFIENSKLISIGQNAFSQCSNLTRITIPDNVAIIGASAFKGCISLTSIIIPDSVTSIGYESFDSCSSLENIEVSEDNEYYKSIEGVLFDKTGTEIIKYPIGNSRTTYTILDNVTIIGASAFRGCISLTNIIIPDSVISIRTSVFDSCSSLENIIVSADNTNYKSIIGVLFNKTGTEIIKYPIGKNMASYTIPDSVSSIGGSAFKGCISLTSIIIPDSVTTISSFAFQECTNLTSITMESGTPPSLGSYIAFNIHNLKIYVPAESLDTYKTASGWSAYANIIYAIP